MLADAITPAYAKMPAVQHLRANGIDFAYLEQGTGPLVLLLHGFPDNARSWSHQMPALAAAGFRAVAPYLRGYPPSEIPTEGFYDRGTLAEDVASLIRQMGGGQRVHLIGQDWGAAITYAVLAAVPELIDRAIVMAVPHPAVVARSVLDARHVHHSFHWWFFQLPACPSRRSRRTISPSSTTCGATGPHPATRTLHTSPASSGCWRSPAR